MATTKSAFTLPPQKCRQRSDYSSKFSRFKAGRGTPSHRRQFIFHLQGRKRLRTTIQLTAATIPAHPNNAAKRYGSVCVKDKVKSSSGVTLKWAVRQRFGEPERRAWGSEWMTLGPREFTYLRAQAPTS